jgi:serine phosphatase RsbU (regulator of sigma subunit)
MGILPDVKAHFANESRLDIAALMEPAKLVGGDLYDCFMLDEHRAYFSIGDVCGKGIPASLFMVISKTLCKSLALRFSSFSLTQLDPGYLMRQANLEISRDNTEMFFVTAVIGVFDLRTGELSYCNAGHDMPLRFAPGSPPTELEGSTSPPICVVDEYDYQTYRTRLAPGEFLCLFTDGVTEAFNAKQEMYGSERLHSALGECGQGATAQDVLEVIRSRVHEFEAGADPSDDLTVMVLRWTPDPKA